MKNSAVGLPLSMGVLFCWMTVVPHQVGAALVNWDGGGDGTNWNHNLNWAGDVVPKGGDDVVIDVPNATVPVYLGGGNISVRSLQNREGLVLGAGSFTLTGRNSQVDGPWSMARGTSLTVRGTNTVFSVLGTTGMDGVNVSVLEGARLVLSGLVNYSDTAGCCGTAWEVQGTNSRLELPALTGMTGNPVEGWPAEFRVRAGGSLMMPVLAEISGGAISLFSEGVGSEIQVPVLKNATGALRVSLEAKNSGVLSVPQLTDGLRVSVAVRSGGQLDTVQLTRLKGAVADGVAVDLSQVHSFSSGGNITVQRGGTIALGGVTNANGVSLRAETGSILTLPALESYSDTSGCCGASIEAVGVGSVIRFPVLGEVQGNPVSSWDATIVATSGGRVELPVWLEQTAGAVAVRADGAGSVVDLSVLNQVSGGALSLEARNAGTLILPNLVDGSRVGVTLRSGGVIPTGQFTRLQSVTADGVQVNFSNLKSLSANGAVRVSNQGGIQFNAVTNIDGLSLYVSAGSGLSLPSIYQYRDTSGCCGATWDALGAGAELSLPNLTNVAGNGTWTMAIQARSGGAVRLGALTRMEDRNLSVMSDGLGSVVELPSMEEVVSSARRISMVAQNQGLLSISNITTLRGANVRVTSGGVLPHQQIIDLDGTSLRADAGQRLSFPAVQRFEDMNVCCGAEWQANGLGAVVEFPNLTEVSAVTGSPYAVQLTARAGGLVNVSSVVSIPQGGLSIFSDGSNSVVDLQRVTSFRNANRALRIEVAQGGAARMNALGEVDRGEFFLRSGGVMPTSGLRTLINSAVTLDGVTNLFTGLTDMRGTSFIYLNGGKAIFPGEADLVVAGIEAPAGATSGQPLSLVWEVRNTGASAAVGPRRDSVFLSTDGKVGGDQLLGTFDVGGVLLSGGNQRVTNTVILPSGLKGSRWFVVQTDSAFQVFEGTNESNNTLILGQPTAVSVADLVVESVTAPSAGVFGSNLEVSWRVRNIGSTAAPSPWSDTVYLSTNSVVSPGAVRLGTYSAPVIPLGAGDAYSRTQSFVLPLAANLKPGVWRVVVEADSSNRQAEADESNNLRASGALNVIQPPLPDLTVTRIVSPSSAIPGVPFNLSWTVTNAGAAVANGLWRETVSLSRDASVGDDVSLVSFTFSDSLAPGAFMTRTQQVTLPVNGPAGSLRVVVQVDSGSDVVESNEANNEVLAGSSTLVPVQLTLSPAELEIAESTSPTPATVVGRLTRNGDVTAPLTVLLSSGDPGRLVVPASLTLPANASTATFELKAPRDGVSRGDQIIQVVASAAGYASATNRVTVLDADVPGLKVTLVSGLIVEGQGTTGTVTREGRLDQSMLVTLGTQGAGQLSLPTSVLIPAGQASATFVVQAVNDYYVESQRTYSIEAVAAGYTSGAALLNVNDDDLPAVTLELTSARVQEGSAPGQASLIMTRSASTVSSLQLQITATPPGQIEIPSVITMEPDDLRLSIPISVLDDAVIETERDVVITVQALETLSLNPILPGATVHLAVIDNDGPGLSFETVRTWMCPSDTTLSGLAMTLRRTGNLGQAATVTLSSDAGGELQMPQQVIFEVKQDTALVNLRLSGVLNEDRTTLIRAVAPGYSEAAQTLYLSTQCRPDLVIQDIRFATNGVTDAFFSVSYREQNVGAPFAIVSQPPGITNIAQNVYLSRDRYPGDDTYLGTIQFDGAVNPYTFLERSATFRLPSVPGNYWVVVEADGGNTVGEVDEANNVTISKVPIRVDPAYTASVQASPRTALAGSPITLSGTAVKWDSNQAAPFELVSLHVTLMDTERVIAALTDARGNYSAVFTPLPGEAGTYRVGAAHPGVVQPPSQTTFTLLGLHATPSSLDLRIPSLSVVTQEVVLDNLGDVALTGLSVVPNGVPGWLNLSAEVTSGLAPFGQGRLRMVMGSNVDTNLTALFTVRVSSAEGAVADVIVNLGSESLKPRLVTVPGQLEGGVVRGGQSFVQFSVANVGGSASGPLQVVLPPLPFVRVATPMPMASLNVGESNVVTLQLIPDANAVVDRYAGNLAVVGGSASVAVPFEFRVLSTNQGTLRIEVTDQFTYYAEGAPRVTNALVELRDPATGSTLGSLRSDAAGIARFEHVTEGYYTLHVEAADHQPLHRTIFMGAGSETYQEALLNRSVVQFTWNVVPTEVADRTRITIESVFEAVVPVPVVTVEPSVIDLSNFPNGGTMNLTVTNHGLLAAQDTRISFSDFDCWKITPLISDLGTLPARGSMVVPVRICRDLSCSGTFVNCGGSGAAGAFAVGPSEVRLATVERTLAQVRPAASGGSGGGCGGGALVYYVPCGSGGVSGSAPVGVSNAGGSGCGIHPTGGSAEGSVTVVGGGGGFGGRSPCDPCAAEVAGSLAKCALDFLIPLALSDLQNCALDSFKCGYGLSGGISVSSSLGCLSAIISCLEAAGKNVPILGDLLSALGCLDDLLGTCGGGGLGGAFGLSGPPPPLISLASPEFEHPYPGMAEVNRAGTHLVTLLNAYVGYFGNQEWLNAMADKNFSAWLTEFRTSTIAQGDGGEKISDAERTALANHVLAQALSPAALNGFLDRWNRTIDYYRAGTFYSTNVPAGQSRDFLAMDVFVANMGAVSNAVAAAQAAGYADIGAEVLETVKRLKEEVYTPQSGICAKVRLRLDQDAVIARDAFRATLDIENGSGSALTGFGVDLKVMKSDGTVANAAFVIPAPTLSGLTGPLGSGNINAGVSASIAWNILPTIESALEGPEVYQVGGSIHYVQDGVGVTVPLAWVSITVHPLAQLQLTYFHQRDVLADDPFTDELEPSVPYSLAVLVKNAGKGTARNLRITSAQPKIVENEKGLLVDFQIIATQVAGRNLTPSLTAQLGDVPPGGLVLGQWLLKSTLQGLFIDYDASFEHLDNLGDPRLSLIQSVEIKELIRMVQAGGRFEDGLPDMLVNEFADFDDLPDTLYLSNGGVEPVNIVQAGNTAGVLSPASLQVSLQAVLPAGWSYLRIPDPGNGKYRLTRVVRSDGAEIAWGTNVWTTDRTFKGGGRRPVLENNLHLLDYNSTGIYTLVYEPVAGPDVIAPSSRVAQLPPVSDARIPVVWVGADNVGGSGIAHYDVLVSVNNAPFAPWLERTTSTGAAYDGIRGNTYAFYSLATDVAGNREAGPLAPDAVTAVNITNTAPVISAANLVVREGDTLRYTNVVSDPDVPPQTLTFSLVGSAPSGMTLNPQTGVLTWPTSEASGPGVQSVVVRVTDNGFPSYSSTNVVTVQVDEVNQAPELVLLADQVVRENQLLTVACVARDSDLPANRLSYALLPGAPSGVGIDSVTGVLVWKPARGQGGFVYDLGVRVEDHGVPSLSATQHFRVTVRDPRGDVQLTAGSTHVLLGGTGTIPFTLKSGTELASLDFVIETPESTLSNLVLQSASSELSSVALAPIGPNRAQVNLDFNPARSASGLRSIVNLSFRVRQGGDSEVAWVRIHDLTGFRVDGQPIANAVTYDGRVFVVGAQPLLDLTNTNVPPLDPLCLWVYARTGVVYSAETTLNLQGAPWVPAFSWTQTNGVQSFPAGSPTNTMRFWRAR